MTTTQRIRLYGSGFILGCALVYVVLFREQDRSYWFPENRVKEKLMRGDLIFTKHAICRMNCRAISEEEVREILKNGNVNFSQSHPHDTPCPSYAFEGTTAEKQNVRIIFASCDTLTTKVVTAIDMGLSEGLLTKEKDTCECK